jgi:two-component system sensor histidine kinase and response regulator WspE
MAGYEGKSLIDLFRAEVDTHTASLEDGLAALASGRVLDAARLEPLARAAHSIKGAARIVGMEAASDVAHGMESCLDAARAGKITIGAEPIAVLRRALELVREAAGVSEDGAEAWAASRRDVLKSVLQDLSQVAAGRVVVPAPVATSRPAPSTMPALARADASLQDLFRMEAESHAAALSEGLLALARDPRHADLLNQLMRAAHSIKGAARIVNVDAAVTVAHVMEDCFIAALEGKTLLGGDDIDLLLRATDVVLQIARTGVGDERQVADLGKRLEAVVQRPLAAEPLRASAVAVAPPLEAGADGEAPAARPRRPPPPRPGTRPNNKPFIKQPRA